MTTAPRRWAAAALLVTVGWLATPQAVPVYDGISTPDEPYRYVSAPAGSQKTPPATTGTATSPMAKGRNANGMSVQTGESGPQASLFVPPQAVAAAGGTLTVTAAPKAPTDQPKHAVIDGNVYALSLAVTGGGPITLTDQAAIATLYLRSTTAKQPGPVMEYRAQPTAPWKQLNTSRGGNDIYVSSFVGAGDYALAFSGSAAAKAKKETSPLLYVLIGVGALVLVVIVVVRVRAGSSASR